MTWEEDCQHEHVSFSMHPDEIFYRAPSRARVLLKEAELKAVREDEKVHPGRLRIEIGGEVMAMGSISNIDVVNRSLLDPEAIVFTNPAEVESFREFMIEYINRRRN